MCEGQAGLLSSNKLKISGIDYMIFDCVTDNSKDHDVMSGVDICRNNGCDLIISVGGRKSNGSA